MVKTIQGNIQAQPRLKSVFRDLSETNNFRSFLRIIFVKKTFTNFYKLFLIFNSFTVSIIPTDC